MPDIVMWHRAGDADGFARKLQLALAGRRPDWSSFAVTDLADVGHSLLKVLLVVIGDDGRGPLALLNMENPFSGIVGNPLILLVRRSASDLPPDFPIDRQLVVDPDDPQTVSDLVDLMASHTTLGRRPLPLDLTALHALRSASTAATNSAERGQRYRPEAEIRHIGPPPYVRLPPIFTLPPLFTDAETAAPEAAGAPPPPAPDPPPVPVRGDEQPSSRPVDISAFAPAEIARGDDALVQVYLHRPEQQLVAVQLAQESDPSAARRGVTTLLVEAAEGQRIDIFLNAPGATIDQPAQFLVWYGEPRACQFVMNVPLELAKNALPVTATVSVNGGPAGSLRFMLPVVRRAEDAVDRVEIKGHAARRYSRAFLSYASPDRAEVLKRAQALKAARIEFFQDLLSLEPGERWEKRLYEEIDRCDLFLLFWSSHARASEWVKKETDLALKRHNGDDSAAPDIVPIVLEGPPSPRPHDDWKAIHFNDWLQYVIAAVEAQPPRP